MPTTNEREMYGGQILARFEEGRHVYRLRDVATGREWIPSSITGRLSKMAKPALVQWAANLAADTGNKYAHREESAAAAARGTAVHAAIEAVQSIARGDEKTLLDTLPEDVRPLVQDYLDWEHQHKDFETLWTEYMVYSKQLDTCGTVDLVVHLDKGERVPYVIDIKTSKRVYPEHALQVTFYAAAMQEEGHFAGARRGILHLPPSGKGRFFNDDDIRVMAGDPYECLEVVRGCAAIDNWQRANKTRGK